MCAAAAATNVIGPTTLFFNAQGTFARSGRAQKPIFQDVTNDTSTRWFFGTPLVQATPGVYAIPSPTDACACLFAQDGGLFSQQVQVTIGSAACTPCPTP